MAVVPMAGTDAAYQQVRNWLCHLDGLNTHAYLLLFALHPTAVRLEHEGVLPAPQLSACVRAMEALNQRAERSAADLAGRAHLVYVVGSSGFLDPARDCATAHIRAHQSSLLSLAQAKAVGELLGGVSVVISTLGSFWQEDPLPCILGPQAPDVVSWALMQPPPTTPALQAFVLGVKSTREGLSAYAKFLQQWEQHEGVQELRVLPPARFEAIRGLLGTFNLSPASAGPQAKGTRGCVASHGPRAKGEKPAPVLLASGGPPKLKELGLWVVDDVFFACKSVTCKR